MAKNKLPKRIGGLKLPKPVRKSKVLRAMLSNPLGRDILANAITAGAGAAAAVLIEERKEVRKAGKKGLRKGAGAIGIARDAVQSAASAALGVVGDAAQSFLPERKTPKGKEPAKHAVKH
jgi:hypothetical protein